MNQENKIEKIAHCWAKNRLSVLYPGKTPDEASFVYMSYLEEFGEYLRAVAHADIDALYAGIHSRVTSSGKLTCPVARG